MTHFLQVWLTQHAAAYNGSCWQAIWTDPPGQYRSCCVLRPWNVVSNQLAPSGDSRLSLPIHLSLYNRCITKFVKRCVGFKRMPNLKADMLHVKQQSKGIHVLANLKCSDNALIGLFSNVISMELSVLQLNYACTWSELDIVHYFIHLHFLILVDFN